MPNISRLHAHSAEIRPNLFTISEDVDSDFNRDIKIQIKEIEMNPIGQRLLEKISRLSSQIYIVHSEMDGTWCGNDQERIDSQLEPVAIVHLSGEDDTCFSTSGEVISAPERVILFHELTHAYHNLSGKRATTHFADPFMWQNDEEYKTVIGFPSKQGKSTAKITENAFRKAEGLPERFGSWPPSDPDDNKRAALCAARVKWLGPVYERHQSLTPENLSPPPIDFCSINDLSSETHPIVFAEIQGVGPSFTPQNSRCIFLGLTPPDDVSHDLETMLGEKCHLDLTENKTVRAINNLAITFFPQLRGKSFNVLSLKLLRIGEEEKNIASSH